MPTPKRSAPSDGDSESPLSRAQAPADNSGFMLWRASLAWQREMRPVLEPHEITLVGFTLLASGWWLNETGRESTQRELADHAGLDVMTTSQVVRRLEAAELVRRTPSQRDARAMRVALTPKGLATLSAALADVHLQEEAFFGQLGDGEPSFRKALEVLVDEDFQH